jgi:uncharacterized protein YidB (DUF937 family)
MLPYLSASPLHVAGEFHAAACGHNGRPAHKLASTPCGTHDGAAGFTGVRLHQVWESVVGFLQNVIRTAVISALGAKLARGRSPIVGALIALLLSRALANKTDEKKPNVPGTEDGLGGLVERFRQGGLEEILKSWIATGPNKPISPNQLQRALGPDTVDGLSRETGLPRDDLLSQLSRILPEVIDRLSPNGKLPKDEDLLPGRDVGQQREHRLG